MILDRLICWLVGHRLEPEDGTCLRCGAVTRVVGGYLGPPLYEWDGRHMRYRRRRPR